MIKDTITNPKQVFYYLSKREITNITSGYHATYPCFFSYNICLLAMQFSFAFQKQLLLALTTFLKILKLYLHLYVNPDDSAYHV